MPELPAARRARFCSEYGLTPYDAGVLTDTRALGGLFEAAVRAGATPKIAANWIATELLRRLNDAGSEIDRAGCARSSRGLLAKSRRAAGLPPPAARKFSRRCLRPGKRRTEIIAAEGLAQTQDTAEIERVCREVIEKNPDNVAKYRAGNEGVFKFFVGQVMRASRGQADPQTVNDALKRLLAGKSCTRI